MNLLLNFVLQPRFHIETAFTVHSSISFIQLGFPYLSYYFTRHLAVTFCTQRIYPNLCYEVLEQPNKVYLKT